MSNTAIPLDAPDFGQYAVEREIGRGGMGIVYLARDTRLDRYVAIKTLPPHLADDPVVRERFLREARTAGSLSHQNIVPIHRADDINGNVFFVMGYVDGESLAQRVRRIGRIEPRELVGILIDVANALGYAHSRGVIHRDVKAENILIEASTGRALVTDFGIARLAEAGPLTATGQVLGTVYYLSPEQVSGEKVDGRSDIYSLGVVAYLSLAGIFPFDAELASAVLIAHVTKPPPPLLTRAPDVPRELAEIVDRCLAKSPDARFPDCASLAAALARIAPNVSRVSLAPARQNVQFAANLVSDTEAQAIWRRAADLQQLTGIQERLPPVPSDRDKDADAARTSGYRVTDVRDAAAEAGIAEKYVQHALVEHGLVPTPRRSNLTVEIVDRGSDESAISGGRKHLEYEVSIDGEMAVDDYDLLLDVIRHGVSEPGTLATVGRSFSWQSDPNKRNLHISVIPRNGKTTIRVSENLKRVRSGLFAASMGGIGGGISPILFSIGLKAHDGVLGASLLIGLMLTTYTGARIFFSRASGTRERELQALAESLAAEARDSIEKSEKKP
jgi:serine/threonine-protein kinase